MLSERLSIKLTVGGGTERGSPASHHYLVSCLTKGVLLLRKNIRLLVVMVDGTPSIVGQRFVWCIQVDDHGPQGPCLFLFRTQLDSTACPLNSAISLSTRLPISLTTRLCHQPVRLTRHQLVHLTLPSTCPLDSAISLSSCFVLSSLLSYCT